MTRALGEFPSLVDVTGKQALSPITNFFAAHSVSFRVVFQATMTLVLETAVWV